MVGEHGTVEDGARVDHTRKVILVRHSVPQIEPGVPARAWHLSAEGRRRGIRLAAHLAAYAPGCLVASTEPKAAETAELVAHMRGLSWQSVAGLHEHERNSVGYLGEDDFRRCLADFFARPAELVWGDETAEQAYRRFAAAIEAAMVRCPAATMAVFTHGTILSLFAGRRAGIDPYRLWQRLDMPSIVVLSWPAGRLVEILERVE